jgi:murein endopeptidase
VRIERHNKLAEVIATNLVQRKTVEVGQEVWSKKAAEMNLTDAQFTEIEIWAMTGSIKYQLMSLTDDVIDALANLVGIEMPPIFVADQPKLKVIG